MEGGVYQKPKKHYIEVSLEFTVGVQRKQCGGGSVCPPPSEVKEKWDYEGEF